MNRLNEKQSKSCEYRMKIAKLYETDKYIDGIVVIPSREPVNAGRQVKQKDSWETID